MFLSTTDCSWRKFTLNWVLFLICFCVKQTSFVCPASRSSNFSPMQKITLTPDSSACTVLSAINWKIQCCVNCKYDIYMQKYYCASQTKWKIVCWKIGRRGERNSKFFARCFLTHELSLNLTDTISWIYENTIWTSRFHFFLCKELDKYAFSNLDNFCLWQTVKQLISEFENI